MPPLSNKILDVFNFYKSKIQTIYSEKEAQSILYLLFEDLFHLSRIDFFSNPDQRLSESEIVLVYDAVEQLKIHTPIQYIIGKTEFCNLTFFVNESTLIPRPETEELVNHVLDFAQNRPLKILDIGTGSGCIAIALKKQLIESEVYACDISQKAIETAQKNADFNQTSVHFFKCDILNEIFPFQEALFDVVVSNPPYIPISEKSVMQPNVLNFEPHDALFVPNENPLIFYQAMIKLAQKILRKNGKLFFEIHENQSDNMLQLSREMKCRDITIEKDIFGKNRFAIVDF